MERFYYPEFLDWEKISNSDNLTEDFINAFINYVYLHPIIEKYKLSEILIEKIISYSDDYWYLIFTFQELSEEFIEKLVYFIF